MYMTIDTIDPEKIIVDKVESKEIPGVGGKYYDVVLGYEYPNGAKRKLSLELPLLKSKGIFKREEQKLKNGVEETKVKYAMMFMFDMANPAQKKAVEVLKAIYSKTRKLLGGVKNQCGTFLKYFKENDDECGTYKQIVKFPTDKAGNVVEDGNPAIWVKLYKFSEDRGSKFYDLNYEQIEWELLDKVEIEICPLIDFSKLYVGATAIYFQWFVDSGVLTEISTYGTKNRQLSTIEALAQSNKDKAEQLEKQLVKMREEMKELLAKQTISTNDPSNYDTMTPSTSDLSQFLGGNEGGMSANTPRNFSDIPKIVKYN